MNLIVKDNPRTLLEKASKWLNRYCCWSRRRRVATKPSHGGELLCINPPLVILPCWEKHSYCLSYNWMNATYCFAEISVISFVSKPLYIFPTPPTNYAMIFVCLCRKPYFDPSNTNHTKKMIKKPSAWVFLGHSPKIHHTMFCSALQCTEV